MHLTCAALQAPSESEVEEVDMSRRCVYMYMMCLRQQVYPMPTMGG
jgi:hypothetical protein